MATVLKLNAREELNNLNEQEVGPTEAPSVEFDVICTSDAESVLEKSREIMRSILIAQLKSWPNEGEWKNILPAWFVSASPKALTKAQANVWLHQWRSMSMIDRASAERERRWPVEDWLYWMRSENRDWFWSNAKVLDHSHITFKAKVSEWPCAWGALRWMFIASGAIDVESQ